MAAGMVRVLRRASSPRAAALSNPENWPNTAVTPQCQHRKRDAVRAERRGADPVVMVAARGQHGDGDHGDQRDRRVLGGEDHQGAEPDRGVGQAECQAAPARPSHTEPTCTPSEASKVWAMSAVAAYTPAAKAR